MPTPRRLARDYTPLPDDLIAPYGFQDGAFSSEAYQIKDDNLQTYTQIATHPQKKPATICNAFLASVQEGQMINAIWAWMQRKYVPYNGKTSIEKFRNFRWSDEKKGRLSSSALLCPGICHPV